MSIEFKEPSLEVQLEQKLEFYREIRQDFYLAKERARYLGAWMFRLCTELASLRYQIANQKRDEQLTAFDATEYTEVSYDQQLQA